MNVTREVIYDLLPGYFSGDISPDTKALVEEFLRQDPEFSRMMERFRTVFREPRPPLAAAAPPGDKEAFERARTWLQKRSELRGYVIAFSLAAMFVVMIALLRGAVPVKPGVWSIAGALAATSIIAGVQLARLRDRS